MKKLEEGLFTDIIVTFLSSSLIMTEELKMWDAQSSMRKLLSNKLRYLSTSKGLVV
jgi:hypothetical protein